MAVASALDDAGCVRCEWWPPTLPGPPADVFESNCTGVALLVPAAAAVGVVATSVDVAVVPAATAVEAVAAAALVAAAPLAPVVADAPDCRSMNNAFRSEITLADALLIPPAAVGLPPASTEPAADGSDAAGGGPRDGRERFAAPLSAVWPARLSLSICQLEHLPALGSIASKRAYG